MFHEPPRIIEGKQHLSYAAVAALTWMWWDTVINFSVEVECIWKRPNTWTKWVYVFLRYFPIFHGGAILALVAPKAYTAVSCKGWIIEQLVVIEALTLTVELVLVMRLYILYNHNKLMLSVILCAFAAEVIVMVTILALVIPKLSSLIFETFLFVLTLVKLVHRVHELRGTQNVLYVFVRDGTWAYAILFGALLLNSLMYQLIDTPVAGMGYFWALSVLSFAGSHVLLNLRRLTLPSSQDTLTTIGFTTIPLGTRPVSFESGQCFVPPAPLTIQNEESLT